MGSRNTYLNGDIELARQRGYDIVQLKYDGWWTKAIAREGQTEYYSETDRLYTTSMPFASLNGCILNGEMMRGTQWSQDARRKGLFFVYDIWAVFGEPITTETYVERYRLLRKLHLPDVFRLVENYPISDAETIWQRFVMNEGFEGIVFRNSKSTLDDAIMRYKREYTLDGVVVGYEEGVGKHAGRMGALKVQLADGKTTSVGNGYSDDERNEITASWPKALGRVMEFTANAVFESGNVRHARFVRWREDKT